MKELRCPNCGKTFTVDEADYASLLGQVKNAEFDAELSRRISLLHEKEEAERRMREMKSAQDFDRRLAEKDRELEKMRAEAKGHDDKVKIAVLEEKSRAEAALKEKDTRISELSGLIESGKSQAALREQGIREKYELELRRQKDLVDYYKDLKARMSTKMIGESLEVHCHDEFEKVRSLFGPEVYFEKDNDDVTVRLESFRFIGVPVSGIVTPSIRTSDLDANGLPTDSRGLAHMDFEWSGLNTSNSNFSAGIYDDSGTDAQKQAAIMLMIPHTFSDDPEKDLVEVTFSVVRAENDAGEQYSYTGHLSGSLASGGLTGWERNKIYNYSISISLKATAERIEFCTENSNYPKTSSDKSGHGIGLKQVKRLLENSYPGKYEWTSQTNEDINTYISKIILYDTKMCNH